MHDNFIPCSDSELLLIYFPVVQVAVVSEGALNVEVTWVDDRVTGTTDSRTNQGAIMKVATHASRVKVAGVIVEVAEVVGVIEIRAITGQCKKVMLSQLCL